MELPTLPAIFGTIKEARKIAPSILECVRDILPVAFASEGMKRRISKACALITCVDDDLKKRGIPAAVDRMKYLEDKIKVPLVETASLEEDKNIGVLWRNLLTNALDPNFKGEIRTAYISIIKDLTPLDARILEYFYKVLTHAELWDKVFEPTMYDVPTEHIYKDLGVTPKEVEICLLNLIRLELVTSHGAVSFFSVGGNRALSETEPRITALGIAFVNVCMAASCTPKSEESPK